MGGEKHITIPLFPHFLSHQIKIMTVTNYTGTDILKMESVISLLRWPCGVERTWKSKNEVAVTKSCLFRWFKRHQNNVYKEFFLASDHFGRMLDHSFPGCAFLFFLLEISSRTQILLFMPGSVHSGSASWDNCGPNVPWQVACELFPDRFPHYSWTAA